MKKKISGTDDKISIFILRSTYFNTRVGQHIAPEFYYISLPSAVISKSNSEKFYDFMTAVYDKNFDNESSINKMQEDYEKYFRGLEESLKLE